MSLLPELKVGWWLLLAILYGVFGILMILFPRQVVRRLYDRSGWTRWDYLRRIIAIPVALTIIGLFIFLPLRVGTAAFWIGPIIYAAAFVIFNVALFNYRNTPLDRPVTQGVYRFFRKWSYWWFCWVSAPTAAFWPRNSPAWHNTALPFKLIWTRFRDILACPNNHSSETMEGMGRN